MSFTRYTELVKLKAVKDKLTLTLTKEVKVVVHTERVSFLLVFFPCTIVPVAHIFHCVFHQFYYDKETDAVTKTCIKMFAFSAGNRSEADY